MAAITEDYVSFETAKFLKEKGFNWDCITYYVDFEPNDVKYSMLFENNTTWEKRCYSAPTLQMSMKWLREVHNIIIEPNSVWSDKKWEYQLFVVTPQNAASPYCEHELYKSYEECVEAGIKYCLENLI